MFRNFTKKCNFKRIVLPFSIYSFANSSSVIVRLEGEDKTEKSLNNISRRLNLIEQKLENLISNSNKQNWLSDYPTSITLTNSLLKDVLTPEVWKRNSQLTTPEGHTINDIIQSGIDNPDHPLGVIATSASSYQVFDEILISIASSFHKRNLNNSNFEKDSYEMVNSLLLNFDEIFERYLVDYEFSSNRNLADFVFSSKLSRSDRKKVLSEIVEAIKKIELEVFGEKGKFLELEKIPPKKNIEFNQFLRMSGVYRDWPFSRVIYYNNNNAFNVFINEEDHIKIIQRQNFSLNQGGLKNMVDYFHFLDKIEKCLNLAFQENVGFLNSMVSNLGNATYFKFKLRVSNVPENRDKMMETLKSNKELNVELIKNDNGESFVEITNKSSFYNMSAFLIDLLGVKQYLN